MGPASALLERGPWLWLNGAIEAGAKGNSSSASSSVEAPADGALVLSRRKKLGFACATFLLLLVAVEVGARVASYLVYDRNPYYLLYGFRSWTDDQGAGHSEKFSGYFKFPPDDVVRMAQVPTPVRINNHGFRGADFDAEKPAGTFRVICMGASSTFGYLSPDEETYPVHLESKLRTVLDSSDVEVLNSGIPHFDTDHLAAILERELLGYEPDLLTLYTGYNDATSPMAETWSQRTSRVLDEYSAAYAGFRKVVDKVLGPVLFGQWSKYLPHMGQEAIERQLALHRARTRANVERILELAAEAGVPVVLIRQPITTWFPRRDLGLIDEDSPRTTYEAEWTAISAKLAEQGFLDGFEVPLYVHHHLLDIQDELAREHGLAVVDNVALVAAHPEGLGSKVHLFGPANDRLATALAEVIAPVIESARAGG